MKTKYKIGDILRRGNITGKIIAITENADTDEIFYKVILGSSEYTHFWEENENGLELDTL